MVRADRRGSGFRTVLATFYNAINALPNSWAPLPPVYSGFRRILLRPFPYKLYFRETGSFVVVSLVVHAARDPNAVKEMLQGR